MTYNAYGRTWWGKVWIEALTTRARLDPNRLIRGRAYARGNRVTDLDIVPGAIEALVHGDRARPYVVIITVPVFDDADWAKLLDTMGAQIGHLAALLDGELPPGAGTGLHLLPGPGELQITCSCLDVAEPCKHAAAVCYLTADALDADPFALLLLRGRTEDEVLAALRDRRQPSWSAPAGMLAKDAYRRELAPLPVLRLPPLQPGSPAQLPARPPVASGVSTLELAELATLAAQRAWELLRDSPKHRPGLATRAVDACAVPEEGGGLGGVGVEGGPEGQVQPSVARSPCSAAKSAAAPRVETTILA